VCRPYIIINYRFVRVPRGRECDFAHTETDDVGAVIIVFIIYRTLKTITIYSPSSPSGLQYNNKCHNSAKNDCCNRGNGYRAAGSGVGRHINSMHYMDHITMTNELVYNECNMCIILHIYIYIYRYLIMFLPRLDTFACNVLHI